MPHTAASSSSYVIECGTDGTSIDMPQNLVYISSLENCIEVHSMLGTARIWAAKTKDEAGTIVEEALTATLKAATTTIDAALSTTQEASATAMEEPSTTLRFWIFTENRILRLRRRLMTA
ncbi:hypothetical protein K432DRAFT_440450 [Lepidopterella palustris CBS 459.81]|uniref:Uncharacterized protein n=1 Tax=Lepidopterella palustris CBS 459.81 TaxID=1314670 RepID=A0A8E2JJ49_9PEZI|nr:hypothetical protein K432DRAFT_440450 [Lepidopterella palustris CBS 459.81]